MLQLSVQNIEIARLPGTNALFAALCRSEALRLQMLGTPAWDGPALLQRAGAVRRPCRAIAELVRQNTPAAPAVAEALSLAGQPGTVFVLTGQQAGMLGGPAYTVYKALTAIVLARRLREAGAPAVPVFWVASEDHDVAEAAALAMVLPGRGLQRIEAPVDARPLQPVAEVRLREAAAATWAELCAGLPQTPHAAGLGDLVQTCYRPGQAMNRAFGTFMRQLFQPLELLFFDPLEADRRPLLAGFLAEWPGQRPAMVAQLSRQEELIRNSGFRVQVQFQPERAFLFYLHPDLGRRRLVATPDGGWRVDGTDVGRPGSGWKDWLAAEGERFSPDALLRPLLQDWLFPTVAYVGGPAELAYHVQMRPLYDFWGLEPPIPWPRFSATLVPPGAARRLEQLQLEPADLLGSREELLTRLLAREGRLGDLERFQAARESAHRSLAELTLPLAELSDDIGRFAASTSAKIQGLLDKLEEHLHRKIKSGNEDVVRRLDALRQELAPDGNPQERVLNLLPWLALFGPDLLEKLAETIDPFQTGHRFIKVEDK